MYVFYDTETTGLDLNFSQILQAAFVFTDDDLNILSIKKVECRRAAWSIPGPAAMLLTGFVPDDLKNAKLSHWQMMREIDEWLHTQHWPVDFAGYNILVFDEDIYASNNYQNLLPWEITTEKGAKPGQENGRFDILQMVRAAMIYAPGALVLDEKNYNGKPALGLGVVARQNGVILPEEDAHDALNDIRATIGIAKAIRKNAPHIWEQLTDMAKVSGVDAFIASHPVFAFSSLSIGTPKTSIVTSIAVRADGSDTQVLFDLSMPPESYLAMQEEDLVQIFRDRADRDKKKQQPFMLMRKDAQPVLMPMAHAAPVLPAGYDEGLYAARAAMIAADQDFCARVARAAATVRAEQQAEYLKKRDYVLPEHLRPNDITVDVQQRLQLWMREFHDAPDWPARVRVAENFEKLFATELETEPEFIRFAYFANRIIFDNAPDAMDAERLNNFRRHIAARVLDPNPDAPYMTIPRARAELEKIETDRAAGHPKWAHVTDTQIRALKLYYTAIEKEYAPFADPEQNAPPPPAANGTDRPSFRL